MKSLKTPTALPSAVYYGTIIAIGFLALAAIAVHDLIIEAGWISGTEWYAAAFRWFGHISWSTWMWVAAIALVVVGLILVCSSLLLRRRTHVGIYDEWTWTRRGDLARRASAVARTVDSVHKAHTVVGRRRATVRIVTTDAAASDEVSSKVTQALSGTVKPLKVTVKTRVIPVTTDAHHGTSDSDTSTGTSSTGTGTGTEHTTEVSA
ncbi:hypothetical protein GCM10027169_30730 [Gordonia jinhuaensis]|uniref:DUF6286 domain-containing protein n=1 Tax=Gordonia jinhuaensis TaxID=1517702 RepID=A0A916T910_9ACTN|nr:hypothetical protein GCM10011489_24100 [Gordonia jinhuaensis]